MPLYPGDSPYNGGAVDLPQFRLPGDNPEVAAQRGGETIWRGAPPPKVGNSGTDPMTPPAENDVKDWTLDDLREDAPPISGATPGTAYAPRTPEAALAEAGKSGPAATAQAGSGFGIMKDLAMASGSQAYDPNNPLGAARANVSGYNAAQGTVDPSTMMSAEHLNKITSQDSANMRRASQQGMLSAASRGLQNSSIAAGAAQGAMVDRATPLAQQDAATYYSNMRANVDASNRAREVSAQLKAQAELQNAAIAGQFGMQAAEMATQVSMANAEAENRMQMLQAELDTAISQGNADAQNRINQQMAEIEAQISQRNAELETSVSQSNAAEVNQTNRLVLQGNQNLNLQFLTGEQQQQLTDLQGQWQNLISQNTAAAGIHEQMINSIGTMMSNPNLDTKRVTEYVRLLTNEFGGQMQFINSIEDMNFGGGGTGGGGTGGGGTGGGGGYVPPNVAEGGPRRRFGGGRRQTR